MPVRSIWMTAVAMTVLATAGWGQERKSETEVDREAHVIYNSVLSPFCPGFMLINCTSSKAAELRDEIRDMLAAGRTRSEIMDTLYARYGEEIRAIPKAEGFGLTAWLVPGGVLLTSGLLITFWLMRRRAPRASPVEVVEADGLDAEKQARIDEELANL